MYKDKHHLMAGEQAQYQYHQQLNLELHCCEWMELLHGQLKVWSIKITSTRQVTGCHPNIKQRPSRNSPLGKANPCSTIGRAVIQHDAPCSEAASNEHHKCGDKCLESRSACTDKLLW